MSDHRNHQSWHVLLSVWATFFFYGAIAAPIPGVNEPHYLCKATHFWQPDWCSRDFFLVSPNAHTVFYATIGCLTSFTSLEQAAWIGRALATLVLAWGWTHCLSGLFFTPWAALWTAWIFLAVTACGNFSGEWLVGGVEGKVFSYGFLLAALGDVLCDRWRLAAIWAGIAVSFHPIVGVWGLLAFSAAKLSKFVFEYRRARRAGAVSGFLTDDTRLPTRSDPPVPQVPCLWSIFREVLLPCLIVLVFALPGLIPVIQLLTEPVSADTRYEATYIQVYFRLAHHLDPMKFPITADVGYTVLLAIWFCSFVWGGRTNSKKQFDQIVTWAVIFAVVGILIGLGPRPPVKMPYFAERMNLLKFYPFRLADVLVPIAVAVSLIGILERTLLNISPASIKRRLIPFHVIFMGLVFAAGLCRAYSISDTNRYSLEDRTDWLDICRWIDDHLPSDALVQTPPNGWAFKWFAKRAEYVAFKDCPQDAAGIVEWNRRLTFLNTWYVKNYADKLYSANELKDLRQQTQITHLLTDRLGPLELEPTYRNKTFQVYDLRSLDD